MADRVRQKPGVADAWGRIEAWLGAHLPAYKATLRPGVSARDLAEFEAEIGRPLPDDVRESWRIRDGQRALPGAVPDAVNDEYAARADAHPDFEYPAFVGPVFGHGLLSLLADACPTTGRSALKVWKGWAGIADGDNTAADRFCKSTPDGAVRLRYASRGWVPLGAFTDTDYFGVDQDPGSGGVAGKVFNFGRNEEHRCVLAPSWAHFLSDAADELAAGNFTADLRAENEEFRMIRP